MGGAGSLQSSTALKYELRETWDGNVLNYCWSSTGFKGCAWKPARRTNQLCSYVSDLQSFTYFPAAAPVAQSVYTRGYTDTNIQPNDVYACPVEDERYVEITVPSGMPTCMCRFTKIKNAHTGAMQCYEGFGFKLVSCSGKLFGDSPWNIIKMNAQPAVSVLNAVDQVTMLFIAIGVVMSVLGVVLQRTLKTRREANRDKEDLAALYSLLDDDVAVMRHM